MAVCMKVRDLCGELSKSRTQLGNALINLNIILFLNGINFQRYLY
jgi:hypothetical protein